MYRLTRTSTVFRIEDNVYIPMIENNSDYAEYLQWLSDGNTPEPADAAPLPSKAEQIDALLAAKGVTRLLVQLTIEVSEDKARALAPSYGMTAEQGIAYAYSKNKSYRECKDLEAAIREIEVSS